VICAALECTNTVARNARGRPRIYCSKKCRPTRSRPRIVVEVDHPEVSHDGRSSERLWTVRLRRGNRSVTVAQGLGWPSAHALAMELVDVVAQPAKRKEVPVR
jgi:hypothetical protein